MTPNLAMVMELMDKCLYEVLHIEVMQLADTDKKSIIKQLASGVVYLHDKVRTYYDTAVQNKRSLFEIFHSYRPELPTAT